MQRLARRHSPNSNVEAGTRKPSLSIVCCAKPVKEGLNKEDAEEVMKKLTDAGAEVELK